MVTKQDWLFCDNHKADHLVFKIVGVSHLATVRYMAFRGQWGKRLTRLTGEVIFGEALKQLTSATKTFQKSKRNVSHINM